jgi:hypothetical protein
VKAIYQYISEGQKASQINKNHGRGAPVAGKLIASVPRLNDQPGSRQPAGAPNRLVCGQVF